RGANSNADDVDIQASERRAELRASAGFMVTTMAAIGLAIVYWSGGQPQLEGTLLAVGFAGLCYGFVTWANRILAVGGPHAEPREVLPTSETDRDAFEEDLERGGTITRRRLLLRSLGAATAGLGIAALFPIRSLGPRPGKSLARTPWRDGLRLITEDGRAVNVSDVPVGGLVTVFPEGHPGSADGQAVLVRVEPGLIQAARGREDWS